jgi:transposase InsO family protein
MIFRVIRDHLVPEFAVRDCCRVLRVSTAGYYNWLKHPVGKREARRRELAAKIRVVHEASRRIYGATKVRHELARQGVTLNRKTVARIMRENKLRSKVAKTFKVRTTDSSHTHPIAENVLDRRFDVEKTDAVWLCDITYIPTGEGFLYLAGVMDMCSRKIVGWSMADHLRVELVADALGMATATRTPSPGLVHHSDRGVQYCCGAYREELEAWGMVASMSRVGDCYDNAPKESFWAILKKELMSDTAFATRAEARAAIFEFIEVWYNRKRIHGSLGYLSPEEFEASRRR